MKSNFQDNSIYFVETEKVNPNPFQPRREFDPAQLDSLSDSIRMYGVLQPLVVTRREVFSDDGGMSTEYELIAGERRLRASKLAGLREVPVIIRSDEQSDREKLEVAIIENLQREDLNPVDRAVAFRQLVDDFKLKHAEVAKKVGKSREYVSNTMRILALPEEMLQAITDKKMTEGHARTLLMLTDRPEEQMVLFKEILLKKLTVRAAEKIARRVAYDKVRKKERTIDPHTVEVEEEMSETLGTRVHIERKAVGGKIEIDFFSEEDLAHILKMLKEKDLGEDPKNVDEKMNNFVEQSGGLSAATSLIFDKEKLEDPEPTTVSKELENETSFSYNSSDDKEEVVKDEEDIKEEEEDKRTPYKYQSSVEDNSSEVEETKDEDPEPTTVSKELNNTTSFSYNSSDDKEEVVKDEEDIKEEEEDKRTPYKYQSSVEDNSSEVEETKVEESVEVKDIDNPVPEEDNQYKNPVTDSDVNLNKVPKKVVNNNPVKESIDPIVPAPEVKEEVVNDSVNNSPQENPRSKYLEKIEPSDMNNINIEIGDDFLGDRPTSVTEDRDSIKEDREELGFNQPNVITDFIESQKEKDQNKVDTPNYGNDEDLYSVKGM